MPRSSLDLAAAPAPPGRLLAVVVVLALALVGCGGTGDPGDEGTDVSAASSRPATSSAATPAATDAPTPAETPAATPAATDGSGPATEGMVDGDVTVAVAASDLGDVLVDGDGMTLYVFDQDGPASSACTGDCLDNWPPLVAAEPTAGPGVVGALDTFERPDTGQQQVTIAGAPLYLWVGDSEPGDVTGHGVGDVWWAVTPAGEAVASPAASGSEGANLAEGVDDGGY